ncbi:MAG TPA: hypothetical protein VKA51_08275 [Rubrobacteraceae bacterium]|nr:hypothetical protein [Rubrobacteraceae bacterium]
MRRLPPPRGDSVAGGGDGKGDFLAGTRRFHGDGDPRVGYDAERDLYRFPDGRFALSREHAEWRALKEAGFFEGEM